jgi:hypothetical protein
MPFHYEQDGNPIGPVTDDAFAALVKAGTITPDTLVWMPGMTEWQPYRSLQPTPPPVAPPPTGAVLCAECGQPFPPEEMIAYGNCCVCAACKPVFLQRIKEGVRPGMLSIWRSGNTLVVNSGAALPDRCVKCNAPAQGFRLKRTLYWHHWAVYLLLLCNLLIFAIVALIVRKRAILHIGLCPEHLTRRKRNLLISWLAVVASVLMVVLGFANERFGVGFGGIFLFLAAAIYGLATCPMVSARRIENDRAWVRGVCPAYLDSFPTWTGD